MKLQFPPNRNLTRVSRLFQDLKIAILLGVACLGFPIDRAKSQDSAPSSHLVFDDHFPGDLLVHQIRVPKTGLAKYTYYEALGWRGQAAGYAGLQDHPRGRNFIFSIWDHSSHCKPIRAIHLGAGTKAEGFGGEGTGLKSWNFELGWKVDSWYTLVTRCWDHADQTRFGFWVHSPDRLRWSHLVTMEVAVPSARFQGATDAFIEDWLNTGRNFREIQLKNGWKRKDEGQWHPFQSARYSVNAWDLKPRKRSYNYRENWNAGTRDDKQGPYYFMQSGGKSTRPQVTNPSTLKIERKAKRPDFPMIRIRELKAKLLDDKSIQLKWQVDERNLPQFGWEIELDSGARKQKPIFFRGSDPKARSATIQIPVELKSSSLVLKLTLIDLLDNRSKPAKTELEFVPKK